MYYITKRDSETGKKFQQIEKKAKITYEAQKEMADKYGFEKWRGHRLTVFGGISSCLFKDAPHPKVWKEIGNNEFMPKLNSKIGKVINQEFSQLPKVHMDELNKCIGWETERFSHIGISLSNEIYFGFTLNEKWNVKTPEDCEEVTTKRYRELFPPQE